MAPGAPALCGDAVVAQDAAAEGGSGVSGHGRGAEGRTARTAGETGVGCTPAAAPGLAARREGPRAADGDAPVPGLCRRPSGAGPGGLRPGGRAPLGSSASGASAPPGAARAAAAGGAVGAAGPGRRRRWGGVGGASGWTCARTRRWSDRPRARGERGCGDRAGRFAGRLAKGAERLMAQGGKHRRL